MRRTLPMENNKPEFFDKDGHVRWFVRHRNLGVDEIQFYKPARKVFVAASPVIPWKFYQYVWEKVLGLSEWGKRGDDRWYQCVDLICDDKEKFAMAWLMFTLEGENDQFKRKQTNKKKSPANRRQPNRAKKV